MNSDVDSFLHEHWKCVVHLNEQIKAAQKELGEIGDEGDELDELEKKIGKAGNKVTSSEFREKCRRYAESQVEGQRKDFIRLGVLGDWQNPYLTMNFKTEADIVRSLAKIIDNGHLVRGFKPVYWSVVGGSALAEAEVEYQDKDSFFCSSFLF